MSSLPLEIRPFDPQSASDWEAVVALKLAAFPDDPVTVETERESWKRHTEPRNNRARFLGFADGQLVGTAIHWQNTWHYNAHNFHISVMVHPDHEGRGHGAALYRHLLDALAPFAPAELRATVREDKPRAVRFAAERGFAEEMREWESHLDVTAFDFAPWQAARERMAGEGIRIVPLSELADDPDSERKVWELDAETSADVPDPEPYQAPTFESYKREMLDNPFLVREGFFIAVDTATGEYAGTSNLWVDRANIAIIDTGLTAVRRAYRRRGIALALKLAATAYARSQGCKTLRTWNASTNAPMLAINIALGYVRHPAHIMMMSKVAPAA